MNRLILLHATSLSSQELSIIPMCSTPFHTVLIRHLYYIFTEFMCAMQYNTPVIDLSLYNRGTNKDIS